MGEFGFLFFNDYNNFTLAKKKKKRSVIRQMDLKKMSIDVFTNAALQAHRLFSPSVWVNGIVRKNLYIERESARTARERGRSSSAGMAENGRSLVDYREPPPLDSNGEISKPRGWGSEQTLEKSNISRDDTSFKAQKRLTEIISLFSFGKMIVMTEVFKIVVGKQVCNQS